MVDTDDLPLTIESGVLYPPIMWLDCDHWSVTSLSRFMHSSWPP